MKFYFAKNFSPQGDDNYDDCCCYPLSYYVQFKQEIELELAERETGVSHFWCDEFFIVGDDSKESCGLQCTEYKPRNGKSGRCKHHQNCFVGTGRKFKLSDKEKLKEITIN